MKVFMANNSFEAYVEDFYEYLIKDKSEYLKVFFDLEFQIERWFMGELLHYLEAEKKIELTTANREAKLPNQQDNGRKKVDLKIPLDNEYYWIELKHILVGQQKKRENSFELNFYFYEKTYIANDVEKLKHLKNAYVLSFVSTNNNKIRDRNKLHSEVDKNLGKNSIRANLILCDFNKENNFGYFLLMVKQEME